MTHVAHEWNVKPSFMGACYPHEDRAYMAAYVSAKDTMRSWEDMQSKV